MRPDTDHTDIAEMLPDYAIGALSDGDLWRIEAHLDTCADCRAELDLLLDIGSLDTVPGTPRASTKTNLFGRAGFVKEGEDAPTTATSIQAQPATTPTGPVPVARRAVAAVAKPSNVRSLGSRLGTVLLPLAAVVIIALVGWNVLLQRQLGDDSHLEDLLADPGSAFALTDSEVPTSASATFYVDPTRDDGLLTAQGLPQLTAGQRYQVWLFTEDGQRVSGGSFVPDASGSAVTVIEAPASFDTYWAVAVSAEPEGSSAAPTSPLLLGGWIR